jgi:hypothetical protein
MLLDELLDVALVATLRPPALVVLTGLLVVVLRYLLEAPGTQPIELSLLATDDGDDRSVRVRDERYERREVEAVPDSDAVPERR